jgi:hypothetical protein
MSGKVKKSRAKAKARLTADAAEEKRLQTLLATRNASTLQKIEKMDEARLREVVHYVWIALLGNFEGKFIYGLHEGRGSSFPSLPLDAHL